MSSNQACAEKQNNFWVQDGSVQGLGFRVQGLGFRVQGLGFRVQGLGLRWSIEALTLHLQAKEHAKVKSGCVSWIIIHVISEALVSWVWAFLTHPSSQD